MRCIALHTVQPDATHSGAVAATALATAICCEKRRLRNILLMQRIDESRVTDETCVDFPFAGFRGHRTSNCACGVFNQIIARARQAASRS
jgi:hypothetical protein